MVNNILDAKELIAEIDPVFDHKSHSDTLGRRLDYPDRWVQLLKTENEYIGNGKAQKKLIIYQYNPYLKEYKY